MLVFLFRIRRVCVCGKHSGRQVAVLLVLCMHMIRCFGNCCAGDGRILQTYPYNLIERNGLYLNADKTKCINNTLYPTLVLRPLVLRCLCFNAPCRIIAGRSLRFPTFGVTPFGWLPCIMLICSFGWEYHF